MAALTDLEIIQIIFIIVFAWAMLGHSIDGEG